MLDMSITRRIPETMLQHHVDIIREYHALACLVRRFYYQDNKALEEQVQVIPAQAV